MQTCTQLCKHIYRGESGIRTRVDGFADHFLATRTFHQTIQLMLLYTKSKAPPEGLEPPTHGVETRCSIR